MSQIQHLIALLQANRVRTLSLLDKVAEARDPQQVLAWRPGPGRAHIGWQLVHIGVTEEIFAVERLAPDRTARWQDLWPRFRGGSTPDDDVPTAAQIRDVLTTSRESLLETLARFQDEQLDWKPEAFANRNWSLLDVLHVLAWHEPHHQGQAHLTLNLYRAAHGE